jgi:hypothetical protein
MNNDPESFKESNTVVAELLAIRTELKKLNQKVADFEKNTSSLNSAKSWRGILYNKPVILIASLLFLNILASLLQSFMTVKGISYAKEEINKPIAYEYQVFSPSDETFDSSMNTQGDSGWQATNCRRASNRTTDEASYECIMIRKKQ